MSEKPGRGGASRIPPPVWNVPQTRLFPWPFLGCPRPPQGQPGLLPPAEGEAEVELGPSTGEHPWGGIVEGNGCPSSGLCAAPGLSSSRAGTGLSSPAGGKPALVSRGAPRTLPLRLWPPRSCRHCEPPRQWQATRQGTGWPVQHGHLVGGRFPGRAVGGVLHQPPRSMRHLLRPQSVGGIGGLA